MQQIRTHETGIGDRSRISPWRTDESEMVNELMGAAWRHHVNRRVRIRAFFNKLVRAPRRV